MKEFIDFPLEKKTESIKIRKLTEAQTIAPPPLNEKNETARNIKLERNRLSAQASRDRKKERDNQREREIKSLTEENNTLKEKNMALHNIIGQQAQQIKNLQAELCLLYTVPMLDANDLNLTYGFIPQYNDIESQQEKNEVPLNETRLVEEPQNEECKSISNLRSFLFN